MRTVVHLDDRKEFIGLVRCGMATAPDPDTASTATEIERCATVILEVFTAAIEGVGTKSVDRGHSASWWNDECKQAYKEYRASALRRAPGDLRYTEDHRCFLAAVRKAKRQYWTSTLNRAITDDKQYKLIAWHKLGPKLNSPPLRVSERVIEDDQGKAEAQTTARLIQPVQRPKLRMPRYIPGSRRDPTEGLPKASAAKAFKRWFVNRLADEVTVFTDGSQKGENVGYGFAAYLGRDCIGTGHGKLGTPSLNFDGEAIGAWKGLEYVLLERPGLRRKWIWVCLDNIGVIRWLQADAPASAQWAYIRFQEAMETYDVRIRWCPGYCGVEGHEKADDLAKARSELREANSDCTQIAYDVRAQGRRSTKVTQEEWWRKAITRLTDRYKFFQLDHDIKCYTELVMLTREELHRYLAVRQGHGDFAWYNRRFRHDDAQTDCSCGRAKAPEHLVFRRKAPYTKWPRRNGLRHDEAGRRA